MKELFNVVDGSLSASGGVPPQASTVESTDSGSGAASQDLPRLVLSALRYRWWLGAAVALPLCALGGWVVLRKLQPSFAAEALLEVAPTAPNIAFTDEQWRAQSIHGFYDNYMRTLMRLATVRPVLEAAELALVEEGVVWRPEAVPASESTDHLGARVQVRAVRETHLFTVRFEDSDASIVAPVVNAVTGALLQNLADSEDAQRSQRREAIEEERERLRCELRKTYEALDPMGARLGSALIDERHNVFFERLNTLTEGMTKVFVDRVRKEGELEGIRDRATALLQAVPHGELEALVDEDRAVADARVTFGRLTRQIEDETGTLSDEHPERLQALQRLAAAQAHTDEIEASARERIRERLRSQREEEAARLMAGAEGGVAGAVWSEERMREVLGEAEGQLVEHGRAQVVARELRTEADRLLGAIRLLDQRIDELTMEANASPRVMLRAGAVEPLRPLGDKRRLALAALALMGLSFGAAVTIAVEWLQRPLRGPSDLTNMGAVHSGCERGRAKIAFGVIMAKRPLLMLGLRGVDPAQLRALMTDVADRSSSGGEVQCFDLLGGGSDPSPSQHGVTMTAIAAEDEIVVPSVGLVERLTEVSGQGRVLVAAAGLPGLDLAEAIRGLEFDVVLVGRRHRTRLAEFTRAKRATGDVRYAVVLDRSA